MIEEELRLEAATTISRYPDILDLTRDEQGRIYECGNSVLAPDVVESLELLINAESSEPPVGELAHDESLQEWILAELESGAPDSATWNRALADAKGNQLAARPLYIRLRLASLFPAGSGA
ncbi:hypothetical protein BH11PSE11_BH11PSE11_17630 [soil metagenome]